MTRKLVFVHGRAQENKDAVALKAEWIDAWKRGLVRSGIANPTIPDTDVRFPYYGDTLAQMAGGVSAEDAPEVIVRGIASDRQQARFAQAILREMLAQRGVTDEQLVEVVDPVVLERGIANQEWFQGILRAVDRFLPGASGTSIALVTFDVFQYLRNAAVRETIDRGVTAAIKSDEETVVVSHSLGTVVAYNILRAQGHDLRWNVPLFVTLGSPLAVTEIQRTLSALGTIRCPLPVSSWFNAMDERDVVSLYPLSTRRFPLDPATPSIENKTDVQNHTDNRHGIEGYLDDPIVARRIYDAVFPEQRDGA